MRAAGMFRALCGAVGLVAFVAWLGVPGGGVRVARADAGGAGAVSCQTADVSVIAGLLPATMHGTLCLPAGGQASTVMVLVPGATYNHAYWDFPFQPSTYDFRLAMNQAGYATLVLDRLGTGGSTRPLSAVVTSSLQAEGAHLAIQALRAGRFGGVAFSKVIIGGHSLGSAIAIIEAATYHDVDGVLLTGYAHSIQLAPIAGLFLSFWPALLDPVLQANGYDPGYLTTRPGTRAGDFYAPATTDPGVVATDEATKDVWAAVTEAPDGLGFSVVLSLTPLIHVPVLIANGQSDPTLCTTPGAGNCAAASTLQAQEAPFFSSGSCLQAYLLPGSGHALSLATDTPQFQQAARQWADTFVGVSGSVRPTPPAGAC